MRALTLTQPWATLVAIGAKRIETRSWRTNHKGLLAIHAARSLPKNWRQFQSEPFQRFLEPRCGLNGFGSPHIDRLPRGMVVAVVELVGVYPIEEWTPSFGEDEWFFGDYSPGRYAWVMRAVRELPVPVPAKGKQGLWRIDDDPRLVA